MRILLTGANGFTGRHFQRIAAAAGHQVYPLASRLLDSERVRHDVCQVAPDAVLHLAGISHLQHQRTAELYAVNTVGTTTLLEALCALPPLKHRVVLASSAYVYGGHGSAPIRESQPLRPDSHYAMSKVAMETLAATYLDRLPVVLARPFNYTGVGQSENFVIPKLVGHWARRESLIELGHLTVEREFNDVRTVCALYLGLLEHAVPGEAYNLCTGHARSLHQVIDRLTALTGHCPDIRTRTDLVRHNEVKRLSGCPDKWQALLTPQAVHPPMYHLEDTLSEMCSALADPVVAQR